MTIGLRPRWRPTHMKLNRTRLYWSNSSERMSCATHCRCPLDLPNNYVRWLATRSRRLVMIGWKLVAWCVSFTHTVPTPRFDVSKMRHPILWLTGWMKLPSNSSNGPMVNILMPPWPIQFSLFLCTFVFFLLEKMESEVCFMVLDINDWHVGLLCTASNKFQLQ